MNHHEKRTRTFWGSPFFLFGSALFFLQNASWSKSQTPSFMILEMVYVTYTWKLIGSGGIQPTCQVPIALVPGTWYIHMFKFINGCFNQWSFLVPLIGGRWHIITQLAIYKWYMLPIGWLYVTYHLLREPETAIVSIGWTKSNGWKSPFPSIHPGPTGESLAGQAAKVQRAKEDKVQLWMDGMVDDGEKTHKFCRTLPETNIFDPENWCFFVGRCIFFWVLAYF